MYKNNYHKCSSKKNIRYRTDYTGCMWDRWDEKKEICVDRPMIEIIFSNMEDGDASIRCNLGESFICFKDKLGFSINTGYFHIICNEYPKRNEVFWTKKKI